MHLHTVLMLAAVGLVWAFAGIVMAVTWLQRHGRLGEPDRRLSLGSYGPVLAGACSGGAAAVHLTAIVDHAARLPASDGAIAFVCSIGAGAHVSTLDASIAGYLPLGIFSLLLVVGQVTWSVPRLWRRLRSAIVGLAIAIASIATAVGRWMFGPPLIDGSIGVQPAGYAYVVAVVFELTTIAVIGLLVSRRPRRLLDRLTVSVADACVGTGLGVGAVLALAVVAFVVGPAAH